MTRRKDQRPDRTESPAAAEMTRRAVLQLPAALGALAATAGCTPQARRREPCTALELVRAEDQLAIRFEFDNLCIEVDRQGAGRLVRDDESRTAALRFVLGSQHLAEQTYRDNASDLGQADSRQAGSTALSFTLPDGVNAIDLTAEALLGGSSWAATFDGDGAHQIELPTGLTLQPDAGTRWRHAAVPVHANGRTEHWTTRLVGTGDQPMHVTLSGPPRDIDLDGLDAPLTDEQRRNLFGRAARLETLILSPYGGWLTLDGAWSDDDTVTRWSQRTTRGRDQHVLVEGAPGHLFPFGHRAAILTVTERELDASGAARLRKRDFITIKTPSVDFAPGSMPFRRLTVLTTTTPSLSIPGGEDAFWIEAIDGSTVAFDIEATDWAGERHVFSVGAMFIAGDTPAFDSPGASVAARYDQDERASVSVNGDSVVVAPYAGQRLSPDEPERSAGDTTLGVFAIRFTGEASADQPGFVCGTRHVDAAVPALAPYLTVDENRGRFRLESPIAEGNVGEVYAEAMGVPTLPLITVRYGPSAERIGGLVTPDFTLGGLSRLQGAVANVASVRDGSDVDTDEYFSESAKLLGVFPLGELFANWPTQKPGFFPKVVLNITPGDMHRCPEPGTDEAATDSNSDDPEMETREEAGGGYTVRLALEWAWDVPAFEFGIVRLLPTPSATSSTFTLSASSTRTFGATACPTSSADSGSASSTDAADANTPAPAKNPANRKIEATMTGFTLFIGLDSGDGLNVIFDKLSVSLAHAKKPERKDKEKDDKEKSESSFKPQLDSKIDGVEGQGKLAFINPLLDILGRLPTPPDTGTKPPPLNYPAKLPDVSDADIAARLGPIKVPDFEWLQFKVSGIATNFGVGLYLFERDGRVPDPLFTLRVGSAEAPITLIAEPWGGTSYLGINLTPSGLTGFQFNIGLVYQQTFNFGPTKALCRGSLSGTFTFIEAVGETPATLTYTIILRLHGAAVIAGFVTVHLALVAVGEASADEWVFAAQLTVGVQIAFFATSVTLSFKHTMQRGALKADRGCAPPRFDAEQWQRYRSAFVGVN